MVLADDLTGDEEAALREHIAHCPSCAAEWQRWEQLRSLLAHLPSLPTKPEERATVKRLVALAPRIKEIDCRTAQRAIWLWLDDALSPTELAQLVAHTANCDRCQAKWWAAERTVSLVRSLPRLVASEEEKAALKAKLQQLSVPVQAPKSSWFTPFFWRVAMPVAAAATLVLGLWLGQSLFPVKEPTTIVQHTPATPSVQPPPVSVTPSPVRTAPIPSGSSPSVSPVAPSHPAVRLVARPPLPRVLPSQGKPVQVAKAPKLPEEPRKVVLPPADGEDSLRQPQSSPVPVGEVPTPAVVAAPEVASPPPALALPAPKELAPKATEPAVAIAEKADSEAPQTAPVEATPRQLVTLPPVTIQGDLSLQPPPVRLTVVPPSQRLYQRTGVALVTVPSERRPLAVTEEKALTPDLSIPLAAERYRSHTATLPLLRFGVSW